MRGTRRGPRTLWQGLVSAEIVQDQFVFVSAPGPTSLVCPVDANGRELVVVGLASERLREKACACQDIGGHVVTIIRTSGQWGVLRRRPRLYRLLQPLP